MANSTLTITVQSPRSVADLQRYIKGDAREESRALEQLFQRIKGGLESANFDVQTSAAAPVRASNTLTLTYASISNSDTVVIAGKTLTCVTGTPANENEFKKVTNLATTLANLIACVNANSVLSVLMKASSASAGVCTLTLHTPGAIGNQAPLVGSTGMVAGTATFASGAGGIETAVGSANYSRGL